MEELSVTEYANKLNITRQAVLSQIKQSRLPENVLAKKIGTIWVLVITSK